jgi:hypothetical protein
VTRPKEEGERERERGRESRINERAFLGFFSLKHLTNYKQDDI